MLNTEARTVEADVLSRRCVMMRLVDFSYEQYQKALRQSAGAVVIILPRSISSVPQDVVRVKKKVPFLFRWEVYLRGRGAWVAAGLKAVVMHSKLYSKFQTYLSLSALVVNFFLSPACLAGAKFVSHLNPQQFMEIEPEMLAMETIVPVYFAVEDEELLSIYEQTRAASASQGSASAAEGES